MNKSIEIKITTKHFKNATEFTDNNNCPLAMAIKDAFPKAEYISVGVDDTRISENGRMKCFNFSYSWVSEQVIYGGQFKGLEIDDMIDLAKAGKRIPTKFLKIYLVV